MPNHRAIALLMKVLITSVALPLMKVPSTASRSRSRQSVMLRKARASLRDLAQLTSAENFDYRAVIFIYAPRCFYAFVHLCFF
jgi:hypothetical protein